MKIKALVAAVLLSGAAVSYADGSYLNISNADDAAIGQSDNTVGAGVAYIQSIYAGVDNYYRALPLINVQYGNFYWKMFDLGYNFYHDQDLALSVAIAPNFTSYDSGDSDELSGMDSTKMSVFVGGRAAYRLKPVNLSLFAGQDVTGRTDGQEAIAKVAMPIPLMDRKWVVAPAISATWLSSDVTDYYYGVSSSEATSTRAAYSPDSAVNMAFTLTSLYEINKSLRWTVAYNYTRYSDQIADSSIVDRNNASVILTGLSYVFS